MPIRVRCACGCAQVVSDAFAGRTVPCPSCGASVAAPLPPPRASSSLGTVVAVATIVVLASASAAYWFVSPGRGKKYEATVPETTDEKYRSAADAYAAGSSAAVTPGADDASVRGHIEAMVAAAAKGDGNAFVNGMHFRRLLAEMQGSGVPLRLSSRRQEDDFVKGLRQGYAEGIRRQSKIETLRWTGVRVVRVNYKPERGEADVFCVVSQPLAKLKVRFWLIKENGAWSLFDYEILDEGMRLSTLLAALLPDAMADRSTFKASMEKLNGAIAKLAEGDLEATAPLLAAARSNAPAALLAQIDLLTGVVQSGLGDYEQSLKTLDLALREKPDLPVAIHLKGEAYLNLGRHEECVKAEETYLRLLGPDPDAYLNLGLALAALERPDEAADAFRRGIEADPDDVGNRSQLALHFARLKNDAEASRLILEAYARAAIPEDFFQDVAWRLEVEGAHQAVLDLALKHVEGHPQSAEGFYHQGSALRQLKQNEKAIEALLVAEGLHDEKEHSLCWVEMAYALADLGRIAEAVACADKFIEADPGNGYAPYVRAYARAREKNTLAATADLEKALELSPYLHGRVEEEPAFEQLRLTPAVQALIEKARAKSEDED